VRGAIYGAPAACGRCGVACGKGAGAEGDVDHVGKEGGRTLCGTGATARAARAERQRRAARRAVQPRVRVRARVGRDVREPERACAGKAGSRDSRGRVREERGGVARELEA
jgi:hypothetical protein